MSQTTTEGMFAAKVLAWAVKRTREDLSGLALKLKSDEQTVRAWCDGTKHPTVRQAQKLAELADTPFPLLLLDDIPDIAPKLPDFRTRGSEGLKAPSKNLEAVIHHAEVCQDWYRDYLKENDCDMNAFNGSLAGIFSPDDAARELSRLLDVEKCRRESAGNSDFLKRLAEQTEHRLGVCVMRTGHVLTNTRRTLDEKEFRGFALADSWAPLVFINSRDAFAAQTFTLIHELVHIGRGKSGVSGAEDVAPDERFANDVAGRVLIPDAYLTDINRSTLTPRTAEQLAKMLRVSTWAVLTRFLYAGLMTQKDYARCISDLRQTFQNASPSARAGGGDFYRTQKTALGTNLSLAMISAVRSGQLFYRDMWRMSGIKPLGLKKFAGEFGPRWEA